LDEAQQRNIIAMSLLVIAGLTLLSGFVPAGGLGLAWRSLVGLAFGWGWFLAVVALVSLAIGLLRENYDPLFDFHWRDTAGAVLLLLCALALIHLLAGLTTRPEQLVEAGQGGGLVGYAISQALISLIGDVGAVLVVILGALTGVFLIAGTSFAELQDGLDRARFFVLDWYRRAFPPADEQPTLPSPPRRQSLPSDQPAQTPVPARPATTSPPTAAPTRPAASPWDAPSGEPAIMTPIPAGPREWTLPSIEILENSIEAELSQSDIRRRVRVIEETLHSFNIDAKVVEVNQGPAVTQFGVQPAAGVSVNRIVARQNDLALALAASPIRIEAPVPGKAVVGIEVPNAITSLVGLRSVIESHPFQKVSAKSKLAIALGQDVSGQAVAADLGRMPHLLIAGATGSGKSVCINSIVACLLFHCTPEELRFIMVDPKMVELVTFNGIPHLLTPVVTEAEKVLGFLKWLVREMERRYRLFSDAGARNIEGYNKMATARSGREKLPYIVLVIDELADIMMMAPEEVEKTICRLAQMSRATGIHLVIATQRPSVDVVTGLIKANFPARISFAVTSQIDSRVILDTGGAEKLLGRGDMLYMASDSSKMLRLQGTFVSDKELEALVNFWRSAGVVAPLPGPTPLDLSSWNGEEEPLEGSDELYDQAVAIVRQAGRASVSLLQRKLRIGYNRAARLIDLMEEDGIVSGPMEGGRSREVYDRSDETIELGSS